MKVLHVYKNYPPVYGGIETHIRTLGAGVAARAGFRVQVLVASPTSRSTRETDGDVEVIRAGRILEVARTPLSWKLCRELSRLTPDLTHLHIPYPMGELAQLLVGRAPRLVATYHSDVVQQRRLVPFYRPILKRILDRADRIIVATEVYARSSPNLAPYLDKCSFIPFGIDPTRFERPDRDLVAKIRAAVAGPIVLFVGALRYYKGLSYLIDAARRIDGTVLLVGSGPAELELRAQTWKMGLKDRVVFAGEIDDTWLPAYYGAADVCVLPSTARSEAFGIAQLEAMASGRTVVSTELGTGTSYVNVHGETGLVVPPRDARALADAINFLLEDPGLRQRLGEAGRSRVADLFTAERMTDRVVELYRSLA